MTRSARAFGYNTLAALLCLSLVFWSLVPAVPHGAKIFKANQDHPEMITDHGHSHASEEDLNWALHGHSHDVIDHEHSQALLTASSGTGERLSYRDGWRTGLASHGANRIFRIERPPRA